MTRLRLCLWHLYTVSRLIHISARRERPWNHNSRTLIISEEFYKLTLNIRKYVYLENIQFTLQCQWKNGFFRLRNHDVVSYIYSNFSFLTQKTKHHMNSFFPRAIRLWNELPTEIKDAPTVPAFASGLNKFYAFNWYFSVVISCFHLKIHK